MKTNDQDVLPVRETFAACEALWAEPGARETVHRLYDAEWERFQHRVVVLDDDPTGVQTVHGIEVVTDWQEETLDTMLRSPKRMFFVLTNSRSFSAEKTAQVHREIAENLGRAARAAGQEVLLISRGDSTLRGHFPLETETLRRTIEAVGHTSFAGEVLCPFFREGGRFTLNGVHYVQEGERLIPAARTEFAGDRTFGYTHSYLPDYIAEKSCGRVSPEDVPVLTLRELRSLDFQAMENKLGAAEGFRYVVADALEEADVQVLALVLRRLMAAGRQYLIRSAAAVPKVFGHVPDRPLLRREEMVEAENQTGGLVVIGSHVQKTTDQLNCLRQSDAALEFIEFDVGGWNRAGGLSEETRRVAFLAEDAMKRGCTAVVYTGRKVVTPVGASPEELLRISVSISDAVTAVVASLGCRPRFLIAKGGITSSDIGVRALQVRRAMVAGQAAPGVPVWKTGPESRFPNLPYIIFPGNVGQVDTLRRIVELLS